MQISVHILSVSMLVLVSGSVNEQQVYLFDQVDVLRPCFAHQRNRLVAASGRRPALDSLV